MLEHRIALLAAAADRGERIIAQHQSIRPLDPGKAQPVDGLGDDGGISGDGRGQRHRLVARAGTDAADIGSGIAIKDRTIFGKGDRAGSFLERLPVGIFGATLHIVDRSAGQREGHAQFDYGIGRTPHGLDAIARRIDRLGVARAHGRERSPLRVRHVHDAARGQIALEGSGRLLFDLCPGGV